MPTTPLRIQGTVAPGFESVHALFAHEMQTSAEHHAQLCVYHRGARVVDLWAAPADDAGFSPDSLVNIFSSGKSLESIAIAHLVGRGLLDYAAPVAKYWPEFAANEKGALTVADVLRHEGGMAAFRTSLAPADLLPAQLKRNKVGAVIERHALRFPTNGEKREYHAITRGWILNEVFRRVDPAGRTIGEFYEQDVRRPLEADVIVGVREAELDRIVRVTPLGFLYQFLQSLVPRALGRKIQHHFFQLVGRILRMLPGLRHATTGGAPPPYAGLTGFSFFNDRVVAMGETPSAGAKCTARGLAKLAAAMAARGRWAEREVVSEAGWRAMHDAPVEAFMGFAPTAFTPGRREPLRRGRPARDGARARLQHGARGLLRLDGLRRLDLPVAPGARDRLRLRADRPSRARHPERAGKGVSGGGGALRGAAAGMKLPVVPSGRPRGNPERPRRPAWLVAVALGIVGASHLACEEHVETDLAVQARDADVDAEIAAEVEACAQNQRGMRIIARNALNAASNPLADRVGAMDWRAFCGCLAPELHVLARSRKEASKGGKEWPYAEFEVARDAVAVRCAEVGIPATAAVESTVPPHPSGNLPANDAKFAGLIDHCVSSPTGYLTNVRVHLEVQRSPRASRAMEMDPSAYCPCYVARMRRGLGDDVAHLYLASARPPGDLDFIAIGETTDDAYDTCAAKLIPFE